MIKAKFYNLNNNDTEHEIILVKADTTVEIVNEDNENIMDDFNLSDWIISIEANGEDSIVLTVDH